MKKFPFILSLLLIVLLIFSLSACGKDGVTPTIEISEDGYWVINGEKSDVKASAEDTTDENSQQLDFYQQDDGTYMVAAGNAKYLSNIVIPETYKGEKVVGIADYGFSGCTRVTSLVISDGVTSIGYEAFYYCTDLASIVIPGSVTSIGNEAFYNCTSLTDIYFTGSESDWAEMAIGNIGNASYLKNATIHFNYVPQE